MAEITGIEQAQADYQAACAAYEKKTHTETRKMNQAQRLAHARSCQELYHKKLAAKAAMDGMLKNRKVHSQ